jgi:hypothetical protein
VAGDNGTGGFVLYMDDQCISDTIINDGKGFDSYALVNGGEASLKAGEHELKIEITSDWIDIDYVEFSVKNSSDPDRTAIPNQSLRLNINEEASSFNVFDIRGRKMASLKAKNMAEAIEMVRKGEVQDIAWGGVYFVASQKKNKQLQIQKVIVLGN